MFQCYHSQIIRSETQMNGLLCMIRRARSRVYLSIVIRFPISNIVNNRTWIMPMKLNKYTRKSIIFLPRILLISNKSPFLYNFYRRECYAPTKSNRSTYFQANIPQFFKSNFPHLTPYLSIISFHTREKLARSSILEKEKKEKKKIFTKNRPTTPAPDSLVKLANDKSKIEKWI